MPNIGPVRIKAILSQTTTPCDILDWDAARFESVPGIGPGQAARIREELSLDYGLRLIEWAEKNRFDVLTLVDHDFPAGLRALYDSPPFIFVAGQLTEDDNKTVAIVGSRNASEYGRATAARLAGDLSHHGVTVVSGLALGVDSSAHRGALAAGGRTIAVLGSGIDVIYPRENKGLYKEIAEQGAVVSEFFPGIDPSPGHFPRRNRVISGLSQAVVVVEAGEKSGALVTADLALSQGKKLFAIPGPLSSRMSTGTNDLIKSGAALLTSVEDIFSVLPELKNDYIPARKIDPVDLTASERTVYEKLSDAPRQLDDLVRESGLSAAETTSYLLSLELRGLIRQLSGKRFVTTR